MAVSDRIAVMNAGRIEQFADPSTLYARPASPFVMDFVGLSTRMTGTVASTAGGEIVVDTAHGPVRAQAGLSVGTPVMLGVRPELIGTTNCGGNRIRVALEDVAILGAKTVLHGRAANGDRLLCERPGIHGDVARGDTVPFCWPVEATLVYEARP